MSNLILIIHGILILLLALWSLRASRILKIPITIHNLPVILLAGLGLCIAAWCSIFKPEFFIPTGILVGLVVFTINSVKIPDQPNPTLFRRICISLLCIMFWSELVVFFWVATAHLKKIDEKSKY